MAADEDSTPDTRRATPLAPLPDHRNVNTPWWHELWRRHAHITTPLRERGLECDIEFGLSAYIVRVSLPDDSYLIIGPPQEPPSERPPGDPEGWIVTRERNSDRSSYFERITRASARSWTGPPTHTPPSTTTPEPGPPSHPHRASSPYAAPGPQALPPRPQQMPEPHAPTRPLPPTLAPGVFPLPLPGADLLHQRPREENSTSWNLAPTSSSVPARNTASSPLSPPPSLRTSPTGSCSASSSNPYPTNLGCSGSANPSARASAAPGRPCTTCAARDTPCRPTSLSTPPPLPTHHGPPRRTALWSAAAVLHRQPPAGRRKGVPRPPPRHRRPGRSHRSPPTHRRST